MCNFFEQAKAIAYDGIEGITRVETKEKSHGRIETRIVTVMTDLDWLPQKEQWNLESLIEVYSERIIGDKIERAHRYYGSSRRAKAKQFAGWIREHWSIENGLHYIMDVVFKEDASQANTGYSAENMSLIRRLALNVINTFDPNRGVTDARRNAAYEPNYLRGLLSKVFIN